MCKDFRQIKLVQKVANGLSLKRDIDFSFIYQNDSLIQNFIDNNEILGIHFFLLDEHMIKYISSKLIK